MLGEERNSHPFSLKLIEGAAPALLLRCKILLAVSSCFNPFPLPPLSGSLYLREGGLWGVGDTVSLSHSLPPSLLGMGCLNRDLCSPSLVSGRWGYKPALVPRWQQSFGYHSFSCLSVSGESRNGQEEHGERH